MIPGTIPLLGGGANKRADFLGYRSSVVNTNSFSFSNVPFGIADPTRVIVATLHWYKFDTSASLSSFSIGGTSPTTRASASRSVPGGSGSFIYTVLCTAQPTGTSGTVSVSFNRAVNYGCVVGLWALYNINSSTPVDVDAIGSSLGAGTFTLTAQSGDLVVAGAVGVYDGTGTTWTNASENYDVVSSRMLSSGAQREATAPGDPNVGFSMNAGQVIGVAGVWR